MILEIINIIGIVCTIYGSIMGAQQNVKARRLNQAYLGGCICFLIYFTSLGLWWNVGLYIFLGIIAMVGWYRHRNITIQFKDGTVINSKTKNKQNMNLTDIIGIADEVEDKWIDPNY